MKKATYKYIEFDSIDIFASNYQKKIPAKESLTSFKLFHSKKQSINLLAKVFMRDNAGTFFNFESLFVANAVKSNNKNVILVNTCHPSVRPCERITVFQHQNETGVKKRAPQ